MNSNESKNDQNTIKISGIKSNDIITNEHGTFVNSELLYDCPTPINR